MAVTPHVTPTDRPPTSVPLSRRLLAELGELAVFAGSTLRGLPRAPRYTSEILRHAAILTRGTTPLMFVLPLFYGFTLVNFAYFFLRTIGASDYTGLATGWIGPRASVVLMTGYVFSAKIGCGIVAELGAARVNEEVDAYESEGVDTQVYLVATRVVATLLYLPIAIVIALLGVTVGGWLNAVVILEGVSSASFFQEHWGAQNLHDQINTFISAGTIAVSVVLVSCFYGLKTAGGPAAVGESVARAIVLNLVIVHVIAGFFAVVFYRVVSLPIGG